MQKRIAAAPAPTRPLWVVVLSAGLIVGIAMGLRQVMGLYLQPMTTELGIGREPFSTSMAIANLIWGIGAVAAGMVADATARAVSLWAARLPRWRASMSCTQQRAPST
ncbi:MAG: MFS transporter [Sphingomonadales bacterium]|nr:MFS transporter [Sphingomonadales bacterium]